MNQTHQSTFTYYVHLSFYFLFNMIIVLYNTLLNIFAWKRRLTDFLLLSFIIIFNYYYYYYYYYYSQTQSAIDNRNRHQRDHFF